MDLTVQSGMAESTKVESGGGWGWGGGLGVCVY